MLRLLCASFILQITTTKKSFLMSHAEPPSTPFPCLLLHASCLMQPFACWNVRHKESRKNVACACADIGHRTLSPPSPSQHARMRVRTLKRKTQADYNYERPQTLLTCQCAVFFPTPVGVCVCILMLMLMLIPHAHAACRMVHIGPPPHHHPLCPYPQAAVCHVDTATYTETACCCC